jgi:hypothetical protein
LVPSSGSVCLWRKMVSCRGLVTRAKFAPIANRRAGCQPAPQRELTITWFQN